VPSRGIGVGEQLLWCSDGVAVERHRLVVVSGLHDQSHLSNIHRTLLAAEAGRRLPVMAPQPAVALAPGIFRIPTAGKDLINSFALVQEDGSVTLVDTGLKKAPARIVAGLASIGKHPRDVTRIVLTHVHPDHAGGAAEMSRRTGVVHTPGHSPGHISLLVEPSGTLITGDALFNFRFLRGARISPAFLCSDFAMTKRTAHRLGELEYEVAAFTHGPEIRVRARETVRDLLSDLEAK
jgi:glyoxylase-like metal-dependent hydrolase (beta-lactamase superfamily II)